jgi:hypothetical protein
MSKDIWFSSSDVGGGVIYRLESYRIGQNTQRGTSIVHAHEYETQTIVNIAHGYVLGIGGYDQRHSQYRTTIERYNPTTSKWQVMTWHAQNSQLWSSAHYTPNSNKNDTTNGTLILISIINVVDRVGW